MFRHFAICFVLVSLFGLNGCDDVPSVSLPNEPPVANDDSVTIRQNESIVIGVLLNDTDIDGDPLTITIAQAASNGTAEALGSGVGYTPNLYFSGSDEFTYEISDLVGNTSTAVVSIDIEKRETRAIFSAGSGADKKLYMIDSREAGTLVDLTQSLADGETLLNWEISGALELAVLLTDAERIVTVPLDDPANPANSFEIDATGRTIDGGLIVSNLGTRAIYTLNNRVLFEIDLNNVNETVLTDTGFRPSTLTPEYFVPLDSGIVMQGTLGAGAEERSAMYFVSLNALASLAPIVILDDPAILQSVLTRPLSGLNGMAWLTEDTTMTVTPAAYSCTAPPPQNLSDLSYTSLGSPGPGLNLNESSGLLEDPTTLISYNNGPFNLGVVVAACPPENDIVQIIEIPYAVPETARVVATADDASDGLWNIDVGVGGANIIYVLEGDTGLRTMAIDKTGTDPVVSDLTSTVPDFQTYNAGTQLPPSVFSTDGLRWLFLAPVGDELTRLEWLQLESSEVSTLDLPFTATNLVSDGFYVFVQGETGGSGPAPVALIALDDPQIAALDVPGVLAETLTDPLNQLESAIRFYPVGSVRPPASLTCGQVVAGSIDISGETETFALTGSAGDIVDVTLTQTDAGWGGDNPRATVVSPSGANVVVFDANARQTLTLAETGTFEVRVSANQLTATGTYNLGRTCLFPTEPQPATLACGNLLAGSIDISGEADLFAVNGGTEAGGNITLTEIGTDWGGNAPRLTLFSPSGVTIDTFDATETRPYGLDESGIYLIRIDANQLTATGAYNLGLACTSQ